MSENYTILSSDLQHAAVLVTLYLSLSGRINVRVCA